MSNPRIIIFSSYTKPYYSGSGLNAFSLAEHLLNKGCNVLVITYNWNLSNKLQDIYNGLKVVRIPFFYGLFWKKTIARLYLILVFPLFFLFVRSKQIIIFGAFPGYLLLIAFSKIFSQKVVFRSTMLGSDDILTLTKNSKIRRYILSKIDYYYATTPTFKDRFLRTYPTAKEKVFLATPGIDRKLFKLYRRNFDKIVDAKNPLTIISVGNIIPRKGYEDIFYNLSKLDISFKYLILGADKRVNQFHWYSNDKMQRIKEYGSKVLKNKIEFMGWIDDVGSYLKHSDVFLLNSQKEGLPNSLLEAMACGVVPVVKRIEGLDNYLLFDKENCLIYDNPSELVFILTKLFQNTNLLNKLSENAERTIKNNFGFNEVAKKLMTI